MNTHGHTFVHHGPDDEGGPPVRRAERQPCAEDVTADQRRKAEVREQPRRMAMECVG